MKAITVEPLLERSHHSWVARLVTRRERKAEAKRALAPDDIKVVIEFAEA